MVAIVTSRMRQVLTTLEFNFNFDETAVEKVQVRAVKRIPRVGLIKVAYG